MCASATRNHPTKSPQRTSTRYLIRSKLEPGIATLALCRPIFRAVRFRCSDAIVARALVGFALAFIVAHLPPSVTTRHFTPLAVALGIGNTAS